LEHKIFLCPDDSTEEEDELFSTKLRLVAKSELHKVVARLRTMPYNDMISWALDHIDIQARSIFSHQKTFVGSFRPKYIQVMYKLSSEPKYTYNSTFILDFERRECTQYGRTNHDIIKTWWGNTTKFKTDAHGIYSTSPLDAHILYIAMMLCRLFGRKNPAHFIVEWVSIINEVAEGYTFNWEKMLSDNLSKEVVEYNVLKSRGQHAPFYMSAYITDAICFMTPFPLMNWSWTPTSFEPIHFYHSKLWEESSKYFFYEICHNVVTPIHVAIYRHPPPRILEQIMGNLGVIADWYIEENFSYIRVFGCFVSPHAIPKFLLDRLVCREVAGGMTKDLKATQKKVWPTFPIQVGMFTLSDFGHTKFEASALEDVKLVDIEYKRDHHRVVENHLSQFNMKRYIHEYYPL
jgi:hypothetical protein